MRHFTPNDFEKNLRAELLNEVPGLILKKSTIPSLKLEKFHLDNSDALANTITKKQCSNKDTEDKSKLVDSRTLLNLVQEYKILNNALSLCQTSR